VKLETLTEVNAERAARRPVIVVTDTANGEQRLVKAKDIAADPLRADLVKQLRMGKSGMIEAGGKKLFLNVYAPTAKLVIVGAVHISQALAPLARALDYYIGALGSRKTHARRGERLKAQGAKDADIARIHAPIGLPIGAVSPSEIAVAIMAEITAQLRLPKEAAA
jgi:xanthine/CO dehydrogenase XdhC/CoxF family maturation factor